MHFRRDTYRASTNFNSSFVHIGSWLVGYQIINFCQKVMDIDRISSDSRILRYILDSLNPLHKIMMAGLRFILLHTFSRARRRLPKVLMSIYHFTLVYWSCNIHVRANRMGLNETLTFWFCHLGGGPGTVLGRGTRATLHLGHGAKLVDVFADWRLLFYVVDVQGYILIILLISNWFVNKQIHRFLCNMLKTHNFGFAAYETLLFVYSNYIIEREHVPTIISLLFFLLSLIKLLHFLPKF